MAAYLELMRQPYSGCNPRGLMLAHDKVLRAIELLGTEVAPRVRERLSEVAAA